MIRQPLRSHQSYLAAIGHRVSGLLLALFLPFHFLMLGTALNGKATMDHYLAFADHTLVKIAEWGLVSLLALHLFFGLRVLMLEFTQWNQKPIRENELKPAAAALTSWVIPGAIAAVFVGGIFLVQAF